MSRIRILALCATAALSVPLAFGLAGCSPVTASCVDWVTFGDSQEMYDGATLVVSGTVGRALGDVDMISGRGTLHEIAVDDVHKGDITPKTVRVAAPRDYCVENPPQPTDDPLVERQRVLLYLTPLSAEAVPVEAAPDPADVENWSTLTSRQGVEQFPEGDELPFEPGVG